MSSRLHLLCRILIVLWPLGCGMTAHALTISQFTASHLGMADGMHSQRVYSLCQEADGSVWWSVKRGVERYNGVKIQHYRMGSTGGDGQLAGLKVLIRHTRQGLCAFDNEGNYYVYSPILNRFNLCFRLWKAVGHPIQVFDVWTDKRGTWFATEKGLYLWHAGRLTLVHHPAIVCCIGEVDGRFYFGGHDGVWRVDDLHLGQHPRVRLHRLSARSVESFYADEQSGLLWLGTFNEGLKVIRSDGREVGDAGVLNKIPSNPVRSIVAYDRHTILVGVDGFGVYSVRRDLTDASLLADANSGPQGVLHGNGVYAVLCDRWGSVIVGSYSGGIDILRPVISTAAVIHRQVGNEQSLGNDHVNDILQLSTGALMFGTDNGASICDANRTHWQHVLRDLVVLDLCRMADGTILAATYGRGVWQVSADGSVRQRYSVSEGTLRTDYVYALCAANDGTLWMGCLDGPLVSTGKGGTHYYNINQIQKIVELPQGKMAVGTTYGLVVVDPRSGKQRTVDYTPWGTNVSNRYVLDLMVHRGKELWIATDGGGVYVLDLHTGRPHRITMHNSLPSNGVESLIEDRQGRVWVGTEHGMAFVNGRGQVANVSYCYGLEREYCFKAAALLQNGQIVFGSTSGAVIINPSSIRGNGLNVTLHPQRVVVQDGRANDDRRVARFYDMLKRGKVELNYDQRTFDLYFEAIHLRNQFDLVYTYRMGKGSWSQTSSEQVVRFSNLEPGTHNLALRCISHTTGRVFDEAQLKIIIHQPWWNSWWMWTVYLLLLAAAFYGAWWVYKLHEKYMRLSIGMVTPKAPRGLSKVGDVHIHLAQTENILDDSSSHPEESGGAFSSDDALDGNFLSRTTQAVVAHLSEPTFTIDRLCREMGMSRTLFYIRLKSLTGNSPQGFIRIIRLERASVLLREGHGVAEAATLTGFENVKYFSTVFKKYFGVPPSKYKPNSQ